MQFITLKDFKSIYDLRVWNVGKIEGIAWGSHCPSMLEKHLLSPLSRDICFVTSWQWRQLLWKTHNGASIVNTDTAHPLIIMCFHQKDCHFQQDNTNRQAEEREKHIKRAHSNFNQRRRPWGWLRKWQKKNCFIVEEACQFAVTMTRPEKDCRGSIAVLYGEYALYQLSVTCVRAGEHVQAGTAFTAALNIHVLQSDLQVWPVYSHSHCTTVMWLLQARLLRSITWGVFLYRTGYLQIENHFKIMSSGRCTSLLFHKILILTKWCNITAVFHNVIIPEC